MKKEDFKDITKEHIISCKQIIKDGNCNKVSCTVCPFTNSNTINPDICDFKNSKMLNKAKHFYELFNEIYMKDEIFQDAKVGDRAWFFEYGWGTITHIFYEKEYPIIFKSDTNRICNFRFDGKRTIDDISPSLFWDEIKFEIPEKPFKLEDELRKLEIKEFVFNTNNYHLV